ncbi:hypothetical protein AGMMS4956_06380 [Bacteroidia bacterium]|nr:hypothetical protein AGMMS4956_06380 [Bacteroidia bacterium]
MKNIYTKALLIGAVLLSSCEFLDVVPDDTAQLADGFKNESLADGFMYSCYANMVNGSGGGGNAYPSFWVSDEFVGDPSWGLDWFPYMKIQQGLYSASKPDLVDKYNYDFWSQWYAGIRKCFVMLNQIDLVKKVSFSEEEFEAMKADWRGQSYFLIGYYHYLITELYGPAVLVDKEIALDGDSEDEYFRKRRPVAECAEFIAGMMDEAMKYLPDTRQSTEYGKPTKLIAQCIKARAYLLSASPLFNGNTDPFFEALKNKDGEQLIDPTYDKEKWKKAKDEFKKAIDMAHGLAYGLYDYTGATSDAFEQAVATARYTLVDNWNKEIIWAYSNASADVGTFYTPRGITTTRPPALVSGVSASLKAVEMFYTKDGKPIDTDPAFNYANCFDVAPGETTANLHLNREPRFYAWIGYDNGQYEVNSSTITLHVKSGEANGGTESLYSGYAIKKMVSPKNQLTASGFLQEKQYFPLIRLTELYLSYCEASAEYSGSLDADAERYFNEIRTKAGIPHLSAAFGSPTGEALVNIVRRERMIDFMFEAFWAVDLKRWKIAESHYSDVKEGMFGLDITGATDATFYKKTRLSRFVNFEKRNYLFPILHDYVVDGNKNLVQNPGW